MDFELEHLGWNPFFEQQFTPYRDQGLVPARVAREQKQLYLVYSSFGGYLASLAGKLLHNSLSRADFPAVGDWVALAIRPDDQRATIKALLPRKSYFSRKVPVSGGKKLKNGRLTGGSTEEQILVANIDTVFLVTSLNRDFNLRRLERYLALVWDGRAHPVVVLNKCDLCSDIETYQAKVEAIAFGVPIHPVSALHGQGLEALKQYLSSGQTVSLFGSSGVGKSTLINNLLGEDRLLVKEIRSSDGRGKHTTSWRELVILPDGGIIIDTPGLRELKLWLNEEHLEATFRDIEEYAQLCRYRNCRHENEPGCMVQSAIERNELELARLHNYRKMKKELHFLAVRKDQKAKLIEKEKQKRFARRIRKFNKNRP